MALQSIKHGIQFPALPINVSAAPTASTAFTLDAASEKAALVFSATAAKSIRTIHIRTATVTTGDTVDVRVETVDNAANGDPTGTLWATNTNGSLVIDGADDNVWKSVTLTADATLAIGNVVAIVIVNGVGGGNMVIASVSDQGGVSNGAPYGDLFTAAWTKQPDLPIVILEYSDGSFEPIFGIADLGPTTTTAFDSGSTTNRRGNIFQLPFPARAKGCWVWVDADGDFTVKLYDNDGSTVLATTPTINRFQRQGVGTGLIFAPFTATASLVKNTNYRVAVVPSTVTSLSTFEFDVPVAGALDMFPGGQNMHRSVFTSGAWVETTTSRSYLGLFLDAFDDGVGGAASLFIPVE